MRNQILIPSLFILILMTACSPKLTTDQSNPQNELLKAKERLELQVWLIFIPKTQQ